MQFQRKNKKLSVDCYHNFAKICERKTSQSECLRLTLHSLIEKKKYWNVFIFYRSYHQTKYQFVQYGRFTHKKSLFLRKLYS